MQISSFALLFTTALIATGCATGPKPPVGATEVGEVTFGSTTLYKGYLARTDYPDSLALLAQPPADGSAALADDVEAFKALTAFLPGPRGRLATHDADLAFPAAASTFSCALGVTVSEQTTPNLVTLLRRTLTDAGLATYKAKDHYKRTRPFVVFKAPICTPELAERLSKDGSYPSGHSAIGWAWALALTGAAPDRADAVLQRGRAFTQSRGVCGVHWKSDIEAGRMVGAATVARLQADPVFRAQTALAGKEIAAARASGAVPAAADCAAEASTLALTAKMAP